MRSQKTREWIDIVDNDEEQTVYRFDLTFMRSNWNCIYGSGCKGIDNVDWHGCCALGAVFNNALDAVRVYEAAKHLTAAQWQNHDYAHAGSFMSAIFTNDGELGTKTAVVNDRCVFLNSPDADQPTGCALHVAAQDQGASPMTTKPEICWTVPLTRFYDEGDNVTYVRAGRIDDWMEGWEEGDDWPIEYYCPSDSNAFNGSDPVWMTLSDELTALTSADVYQQLAMECEARAYAVTSIPEVETPVTLWPRRPKAKGGDASV